MKLSACRKLATLIAGLSCCLWATRSSAQTDAPSVASLVAPIATLATTTNADSRSDYRLSPQDTISVQVVGEPELTTDRKVGSGGTITYPYLGKISVGGKTVAQVESLVRDLLAKDYLVDPQVVVGVKEYAPRRISVIGEVNKPGVVELPAEGRLDIVEAIAFAGGFTRTASKSKIEVKRQGQTFRFKLDDLLRITDPEQKFWLQPNDTIRVGESLF